MFGRELELPIDLIIGNSNDPCPETYQEFNAMRPEKLETGYEIGRNKNSSQLSPKNVIMT